MDEDKSEIKTIKEIHEMVSEAIVHLGMHQVMMSGKPGVNEVSQCLGQLRAGRTWLGRFLEKEGK